MKKQAIQVIPAKCLSRPLFVIKPEKKSRKEQILALLIELIKLVSE